MGRGFPGVEARDHVLALEPREPEQAALALVQCEHEAGALDDGETDGDVARPLRDLLLPDLALVLPLLELRDHHASGCARMVDAVMYGAQSGEEDRDVGDGAAGEEVEEADRAPLRRRCSQLFDRGEVHVGTRQVCADPVEAR